MREEIFRAHVVLTLSCSSPGRESSCRCPPPASLQDKWTDKYLTEKNPNMAVQAELHKSEIRGGPSEEMTLKKYLKAIDKRPDELYAVIGIDQHSPLVNVDLAETSKKYFAKLVKKAETMKPAEAEILGGITINTNVPLLNNGGPLMGKEEEKLLSKNQKLADKIQSQLPEGTDYLMARDVPIPKMIRCQEILAQSLTLWFSAGGTSSVLHQDDADNLLMMVEGRKDVMLLRSSRI